jgi:hypothetical protein
MARSFFALEDAVNAELNTIWPDNGEGIGALLEGVRIG